MTTDVVPSGVRPATDLADPYGMLGKQTHQLFLIGTLRVEVRQLREVEPDHVCTVGLELGTMTRMTGSRRADSAINEIFFIPINREQERSEDELKVTMHTGGRKMGSSVVALQTLLDSKAPNDVWLDFENSGGVHLHVHYFPWPDHSLRNGRIQSPDYADMSLAEAYMHQCINYRVKKPNSAILALLPTEPKQHCTITELNLGNNVLGDKGLLPVLEIISVIPVLQVLNLDSNDLANASAKAMSYLLRKHPSLHTLSVCNNIFFEEAGQHLLMLIKVNNQITKLKTWGNDFTPYLAKRLVKQIEVNVAMKERKAQSAQVSKRDMKLGTPGGPLTQATVQNCQKLWQELQGNQEKWTVLVDSYETNLEFALDASIRDLFSAKHFKTCPAASRGENTEVDTSHLFWTLLINTVPSLKHWDTLQSLLHDLGKEYDKRGVAIHHYSMVEGLLSEALGAALGDQYTVHAEDDWGRVLSFVTFAMASQSTLGSAGSL